MNSSPKSNWRRHFFTYLALIPLALSLVGWWHSTREWLAWDAETPVGILKVQSESSIFGVGAQFMMHEHRWSSFVNTDPVWGDKMRWLAQWPNLKLGQGLFLIILPYWQVALLCLLLVVLCFWLERRRLKNNQWISPQ